MLSNIYWILAILVMLVLLANGIYTLIASVNNEKEYKKFRERQNQLLKKYESEDK